MSIVNTVTNVLLMSMSVLHCIVLVLRGGSTLDVALAHLVHRIQTVLVAGYRLYPKRTHTYTIGLIRALEGTRES